MKLFGIPLIIERSFWLTPGFLSVWVAGDYGFEAGFRMFVLVLLIFACVVGHELTHALVARRFGIRVPQITLYPMGGVASIQGFPKKPSQEFLISVVGPLFNFALAGLLYFPFLALLGREALFSPSVATWPQTFANVFWANPILGAFNLIPAFPMDGGRILRSMLTPLIRYDRATRICVFLGQLFAILFFFYGIWKHHWMLVMVGVYVFFAASREASLRQAGAKPGNTNEPSA